MLRKRFKKAAAVLLTAVMTLGVAAGLNFYAADTAITDTTNQEQAAAIVAQMTTHEKLGQMIALDVRSWGGAAQRVLQSECAQMIADYALGGICLFTNNFSGVEQAVRLTDAMQRAAVESSRFNIPMLLSIDQEGGYIVRLEGIGTTMPGNMALGATADPALAYQSANVIGREIAALGVNLDFAPDLDVNINPDNPVIGVRSFGSDPTLAGALGVGYVKGLQDAGILASGKHFPGHGNTGTDTHIALATVPGTKDELMNRDLVPFKMAIDAGIDMIMSAHVTVAGLDDSEMTGTRSGNTFTTPATLSKKIMTDLLRDELGFEGLVVTDAMNMAALNNNFLAADMVELAIMAGIDLPLMPVAAQSQANVTNNVAPLYQELEARAAAKPALMARINESATRILTFKIDRGIYDPAAGVNQPCFSKPLDERIAYAQATLRSAENIASEKAISDKAITLAKNDVIDGKAVLPFDITAGDSIFVLGPLTAQNNMIVNRVNIIIADAGLTGSVTVSGSTYGTGATSFTDAHRAAIDSATHIIIGSTVVDANSRRPGTTGNGGYATNASAIWNYIGDNGYGGKAAGISYALPYELSYLDYCSAMVNASCRAAGATVQIYGSAVDAIFGVFNPTGKFQVDVPHPTIEGEFIRKVGDTMSYAQGPVIIGDTNKEKAESIASQMTIREKIGQVLTMDTLSWNGTAMTRLTEGCAQFLRDYHIGGFILYGNNVNNIDQVAELIYDIQSNGIAASRFNIPLFMTADQEGGSSSLMNMATLMPGNMALGSTADPEQSYDSGYVIGKELSTIGINVAFSTSVDVNINPDNPVIGIRSFSSNPNLVADLGVAQMKGLQDGGVIATIKHFPGHGNTGTDTHSGMTIVPGTKEELMATELLPFQAAIDNGAEMIMTGHLVVRGLDDSEVMATAGSSAGTMVPRPSTFSHKIMTELLREEMGYEGMLITDAMNMGAIANYFAPADRVQLCLEAGIDIPLIPVRISGNNTDNIITNTIEPMFATLEERAAANGGDNELMRSLDRALVRVLTYKMDRGIYDPDAAVQPYMALSLEERKAASNAVIRSEEHIEIEKRIADKSVVLAENKIIGRQAVLPFTLKDGQNIYVLSAHNNYTPHVTRAINEIIEKEGFTNVTVTTTNYGTTNGAINDTVKSRIDDADYVIIGSLVSNAASRNPNGTAANNRYAANAKAAWDYVAEKGYGAKTTGISYQLPYELSYLDYCSAMVNTSSGANATTFANIQNYRSAVQAIFGYINPTGKFPVDVPKPGTDIGDNDLIRKVGDTMSYAEFIPVESLEFKPAVLTLKRGRSVQLNAVITPADSNERIVWISGDSSKVRVNQDGTATALQASGFVMVHLMTEDGRVGAAAVIILMV